MCTDLVVFPLRSFGRRKVHGARVVYVHCLASKGSMGNQILSKMYISEHWVDFRVSKAISAPLDVDICRLVIFTRGQFWPSRIAIACVYVSNCVFVCVCINHFLVRTITHQPFKLESPNLEQRCKTPWLRSLLFLRWSTLNLKVKFNFKVEFYYELILSLSAR